MFQRQDQGYGGGRALAAGPAGASPGRGFGRAEALRETIDDLGFHLVVDLGACIGSRAWWRGLVTCVALCAAAIAMRPSFEAVTFTSGVALPEAQFQEQRAIAIAPLALGADTGRRMAPTDAVQPLAGTPERPRIELTATLGQGDGFARSLKRAGVADAEADRAAALVSGATALGDLAPGTRVDVVLGRRASTAQARPLESLRFRASIGLKLAVERAGAGLRLERTAVAVDETPLRIRGAAGGSLYLSARNAGAPGKAIETYLRALSTRLSVGHDVSADDRFDIIVEHKRAVDGMTETGKLLYAGLDQGRHTIQLLRWTVGGREQWLAPDGLGERTGGMTMPVAGRLTSGFGMRFHPILGFSRMHQGIDLAAAYGAPIVAAAAGRVVFAGWHGGHGNYVRIDHGGGVQTGYGHMSRIVATGGQVAQGQLIGYVGTTGLSTGPHLHYEVWRGGVAVNPATFAFSTVTRVAGADLARFKATLARLLAVRTAG